MCWCFELGSAVEVNPDEKNEMNNQIGGRIQSSNKYLDDSTSQSLATNSNDDNQKKKLTHFMRVTEKKFSDHFLLNQIILRLKFGIYPYIPVNEKSSKMFFKPFIYVEYLEEKYNLILEVGSFSKKDRDNDVSCRTHIWGEGNKPGIEYMEKCQDDFNTEFGVLINPLQDEQHYVTFSKFLVVLPIKQEKRLTLFELLDKVDPNKNKYLMSKLESKKTNCLRFCIDVIETAKNGDYILIDEQKNLDYFERLYNITKKFKNNLENYEELNDDIKKLCSVLGVNKNFGS